MELAAIRNDMNEGLGEVRSTVEKVDNRLQSAEAELSTVDTKIQIEISAAIRDISKDIGKELNLNLEAGLKKVTDDLGKQVTKMKNEMLTEMNSDDYLRRQQNKIQQLTQNSQPATRVDSPVPERVLVEGPRGHEDVANSPTDGSSSDATIRSPGSPGPPAARRWPRLVPAPTAPPPADPPAQPPSRLWQNTGQPRARTSFDANARFIEDLLTALEDVELEPPDPLPPAAVLPRLSDLPPADTSESAEYQFSPGGTADGEGSNALHPEGPNLDDPEWQPPPEAGRRRRAKRIRRNAYRVNLATYNAQGRGESDELHARYRYFRDVHLEPRFGGNATALDAIAVHEAYYTKAEDEFNPGPELCSVKIAHSGQKYCVVSVCGAAVVVFNPVWIEHLKKGRCQVWGRYRAVVLRLPGVSVGSVYAPALSGNGNETNANWCAFEETFAQALRFARVVRKEDNPPPAILLGNRAAFIGADNVGPIGNQSSRERAGYHYGLTTGQYGCEDTNRRGLKTLGVLDESRFVSANNLFQQPVGPSPVGPEYAPGRVTHYSLLRGQWRELDYFFVPSCAAQWVSAVGSVDFGVGSDHFAKVIQATVETQHQRAATVRKKRKTAAQEPEKGTREPLPLWRATDEAKSEFSDRVAATLVELKAGAPSGTLPLVSIPRALVQHSEVLVESTKEQLETFEEKRNVAKRRELLDSIRRLDWRIRYGNLTAGSEERSRVVAERGRAQQEFEEFTKTQKSALNVEAYLRKVRALKSRASAHPHDPEAAA
eukprot:g1560.t1